MSHPANDTLIEQFMDECIEVPEGFKHPELGVFPADQWMDYWEKWVLSNEPWGNEDEHDR